MEEILNEIGVGTDENEDTEENGQENWEEYETDSENEANEMDEG